jgi:WD40 repeat protein
MNERCACRLATLRNGDNVVSACRYFDWAKCVLSAGWDGMVRAFAPAQGQWKTAPVLDRELSVGSAINCLDCHPTRPVIVVGCWDATLKLYQLAPVKRLAIMRGHDSAVRTVQFVAMGKQIISTGMDGDIRVWSTDHGVQVGMFAGHTLPVRAMAPIADDIVTVSDDTTVKVR